MTTDLIKWGILGTGGIARMFTADLLLLPDHEVAAVGSRASDTAARCLRAGLLESPGMPLDESVDILRTVDSIAAQVGLARPPEST
jgi:predicted dehydrogenase